MSARERVGCVRHYRNGAIRLFVAAGGVVVTHDVDATYVERAKGFEPSTSTLATARNIMLPNDFQRS